MPRSIGIKIMIHIPFDNMAFNDIAVKLGRIGIESANRKRMAQYSRQFDISELLKLKQLKTYSEL